MFATAREVASAANRAIAVVSRPVGLTAATLLLRAWEFALAAMAASECIELFALYHVRSPANPVISAMPPRLMASFIAMSSRKEG
jgi:hypothetical protein